MPEARPRLRRDLIATPLSEDGFDYVEIRSDDGAIRERFYAFEHAVARQLDGRPLSAVAVTVRTTLGLPLSVEQLDAFVARMDDLGLLEKETFTEPETTPSRPRRITRETGARPAAAARTAEAPGPSPTPPEPRPSSQPKATAGSGPAVDAAAPAPGGTKIGSGPQRAPEPARPAPAEKAPASKPAAAPPAKPAGATPPPLRTAPPPLPPAARATSTAMPKAAEAAPKAPPTAEKAPATAEAAAASENVAPSSPRAPEPAPKPEPAKPAASKPAADKPAAAKPVTTKSGPAPARARSDDSLDGLRDALAYDSEPTAVVRNIGTLVAQAEATAIRDDGNEKTPPPELEERTERHPGPRALEPTDRASAAETVAASPTRDSGPTPTPSPPAPVLEGPPAQATPRRRAPFAAALGLGAAIALGTGVYLTSQRATVKPLSVRTKEATPTVVYRYFETAGAVKIGGLATLSFETGGRVAEVKPKGSRIAEGEPVAMLDSGRRVAGELAHLQERLTYYQEMRDKMRAAGNRGELRQAELKVAEKQRLIGEARLALAKVAVLAPAPVVIEEPLVAVGANVKPGTPAVRLTGGRTRAVFALTREEREHARRLAFCRVEIGDKAYDCEPGSEEESDEAPLAVNLPADAAVAADTPARLARARFEGVFTVPASALVEVGATVRVYVANTRGRAEVRAVALADKTEGDAIITQGLDVGDAVIVDPPKGLAPDTPVAAETAAR